MIFAWAEIRVFDKPMSNQIRYKFAKFLDMNSSEANLFHPLLVYITEAQTSAQ